MTQVSARIIVEKNSGTGTEVCMAQTKVQYHPDTARPSTTFTNVVNGANKNVEGRVSCGNDFSSNLDDANPNTIAPDDARTIRYTVQGSEAGQIFACSVNNGPWAPCWLPAEWLTPVVPNSILRSYSRAADTQEFNQKNKVEMSIVWPKDGTYELSVDSIDTSADPNNWSSGGGKPSKGSGGSIAKVELDLVRPVLNAIDFSGTQPGIPANGFNTDERFLCSLSPVNVNVSMYRDKGDNHGNETCNLSIQRASNTGHLQAFYSTTTSGDACTSWTISNAMISGVLQQGNQLNSSGISDVSHFGMNYSTDTLLASSGTFNSDMVANITVGVTIRDTCNNERCVGIPGGYGPTDPYWKYCFYGSPERFTSTAGNSFLSRSFEVNLDQGLLNSVLVQNYSTYYPSLFENSAITATWPTKTTALNLSNQNYVGNPAPKFVVRSRTVGLIGITDKAGVGEVVTTHNISSSITGCTNNNVQVELLSGCTGRTDHLSRISDNNSYNILREIGEDCTTVSCEGVFPEIACSNLKLCEKTPYAPPNSQNFQFSGSKIIKKYSTSADCYAASGCTQWNAKWSSTCIKDTSSTTDAYNCEISNPGNVGAISSEICPNLSLGLTPRNSLTPKVVPMPSPAPFARGVSGECNSLFQTATQTTLLPSQPGNPTRNFISSAGSQTANSEINTFCGCLTLCERGEIFRNGSLIERPKTCNFGPGRPPSIDIPDSWKADPNNPDSVSCADFYIVDYRSSSRLGCATNNVCESYGMGTINNDELKIYMGKDSSGNAKFDMCNLYLNAVNVYANLSSTQQSQCTTTVQTATNSLTTDKSWCDLTSDTLSTGYKSYPQATPVPIVTPRNGFCLP